MGGGTTDFTLIQVQPGDRGDVRFHRFAVGDHLILGGDNLDLALAHFIEQQLTHGGKLEPRQWSVLVRRCQQVKESLLGTAPPDRLTVNVPGSGSRLIGASLNVELTTIIPVEVVEKWIGPLADSNETNKDLWFAIMQMIRRTGDRYRDLSEAVRDRVLARMATIEAPPHYIKLVRDGGELEQDEQDLVFGESLPHGLQLR